MKMLKREKKKKRGIALIMALWIMVALLVICASFVYMMRIEMRIAKDYTNGVKAHYLAKAGIAHALALLKNDTVDDPPNYIKTDSLHEDWFTRFVEPGSFGYIDYLTSPQDSYDEMVWETKWWSLGEGGYQVRLIDEAGMHNINAQEGGMLNPDNLSGMVDLLKGGDDATQEHWDKACRIRDYQDSDEDDTVSTTSWDGWTGYGEDGSPPAYKNYYYDTIREIQKVAGINVGGNPLADHTNELTVYSHDPDICLDGTTARVNLNTGLNADIWTVLNDAGDATPATAAANIAANRPVPDGWLTVGQIGYPFDLVLSGTSEDQIKTMRRVADKFTVASAATDKVYYKPGLILGPININTAPRLALSSLSNVSSSRAKDIIRIRHYPDYESDSPAVLNRPEGAVLHPGFTFGVEDSILSYEYGRGEISLVPLLTGGNYDDLSDQVTVRSDRFRIVSTGKVLKGGEVVAQRKIEAVVDRGYHVDRRMGPFEILYWSETVPEY